MTHQECRRSRLADAPQDGHGQNQRMVEIARAADGEGDLAANTKGVDAQSMGILCLPAVHFR